MLDNLLQIILGILAFIGTTLLVVLGLVLLVLLLVLFVPVRYNGEFIRDTEQMQVRVKITWLLRFVRAHITYEKELLVRAFVLFFKVYDSSLPAKEKKEKKTKKVKSADRVEEAVEQAFPNQETMEKTGTDEKADTDKKADTAEKADGAANPAEGYMEDADDSQMPPVDEQNPEQKQSFIEKIKGKIKNIICKCKSICDKIKSIVKNINDYIEILKEEETSALMGRCKGSLFKVLKSIRPRKLKADLVVGTGSPDSTGYLMAVAGMLYPTFGKHVNIVPDFENTIFEGRIFLKGRITVFVILMHALKLYMDKELGKLVKRLKREDA